jgi:hypothetical protein
MPTVARVENPAQVQVLKAEGFTCVLDRTGNSPGFAIQVKQPLMPGVLKLVINKDGIELNNGDRTA